MVAMASTGRAQVTHSTTTVEFGPELVRRAQEGDRAALRTLVESAYPLVRRWSLVRLADEADADDLTQEVMIQVIRRLKSFRGESLFTTWLYQLTRNAAVDKSRASVRRSRARERMAAELPAYAAVAPEVDESLRRQEQHALLRPFFDELPERQRAVFDLVELQDRPTKEVAEMLGIEPVSVRANLFKARRTLRQKIMEAYPRLMEETL